MPGAVDAIEQIMSAIVREERRRRLPVDPEALRDRLRLIVLATDQPPVASVAPARAPRPHRPQVVVLTASRADQAAREPLNQEPLRRREIHRAVEGATFLAQDPIQARRLPLRPRKSVEHESVRERPRIQSRRHDLDD